MGGSGSSEWGTPQPISNVCQHSLSFPVRFLQGEGQQIAKGAVGKGPRQKTSKIVKKCQKVFRHFSTIFAQGKKRQKSSKSARNIFDTYRQFSRGSEKASPRTHDQRMHDSGGIQYTHELLFSNYLGDYSCSFQGSFELISITVTVSFFF